MNFARQASIALLMLLGPRAEAREAQVTAGTGDAVALPEADQRNLDLLGRAAHAAFYASDQFRCRGMSFTAARRNADRALGRDFNSRLEAAAHTLRAHTAGQAVEDAMTIVPIGYKLGTAYCRKASGYVAAARQALLDLERRLETR